MTEEKLDWRKRALMQDPSAWFVFEPCPCVTCGGPVEPGSTTRYCSSPCERSDPRTFKGIQLKNLAGRGVFGANILLNDDQLSRIQPGQTIAIRHSYLEALFAVLANQSPG